MTKAESRKMRLLREWAGNNEQPLRVAVAAFSGAYDASRRVYLIPSETFAGKVWAVDLENNQCPCPAFGKCYHIDAARLIQRIVERSQQCRSI